MFVGESGRGDATGPSEHGVGLRGTQGAYKVGEAAASRVGSRRVDPPRQHLQTTPVSGAGSAAFLHSSVTMNDDRLSPGQQTLVDALQRLHEPDLGAGEPATVFRPTTWAMAERPGLDLAALAAHGDETRAGATAESSPEPAPPPADLPPAAADLTAIVAAVKSGAASAAAVLAACEARIGACNPALNAFVTLSPERAAAEARAVDEVVGAGERPRPLAGAPVAHKDIIATEGVRTTAGSALLRDYVPREDATVVARLTNAGTVLVGKTNTHEFATGTTGTVSHFGAVRNPWSLDRISGGSSSGAAAALAAGMVPAATGTDTGGSIRIPAACCGIVGLKPTYGRVSRSGVIPFAWGLDHVGPMARRVRDVALLLTAMAGPDPYDRAAAGDPAGDFGAALDGGVAGLRFALPEPHFLDEATTAVAAAVRQASGVLEGLGAEQVEVRLPAELELVGPAAIALFLAEGGAVHQRTLASRGEAYCDETRAFLNLAENVSAAHYLQAQRLRALLCDAMARLFQQVDVLLTPTLPIVAPSAEARLVDGKNGPLDVRAAMTLFTRPFNLTGLPALSLPCGFHDDLPVGLQVVGRAFDEGTVLRVAAAYEEATDWHRRRPALFPSPST